MNKVLISGLLLASSALHATCGDLEIKIINNSAHTCTFKNKIMYYGTMQEELIPSLIPTNQESPSIVAHQDWVGIGVTLAYTCDNEIVKFYSYQEHCGFFGGAGSVGGLPNESTTLNISYETKVGNYITGRPGQIIWRIS